MSNPAIDPDRGVVYVGSDSHYVYALEAATGDELWSTDVDGHVIGSITATAETIPSAPTTPTCTHSTEKPETGAGESKTAAT